MWSTANTSETRLKIAQVSPLIESVPPKLYGGTERIVSYLTEELVQKGHHVTLFASGDSKTAATLVPILPQALRLDASSDMGNDHFLYPHLIMLDQVKRRAHEFDVIHFHIDSIHLPAIHEIANKTLTTLHGRLDLKGLQALYEEFSNVPFISISDSQWILAPPAKKMATVYHGLPLDLYKPYHEKGRYLAFLGRISREKRPDLAIAIAEKAGLPIKIAAKIDSADKAYFEAHIRCLFDSLLVDYVGEINDTQKNDFLGNASALIFPIDWEEPFGLTMIEAMACGTPVIAFRRGSVPEIIDHGVSGFIVDTVDEAVAALRTIDQLDRQRIRSCFEERFTAGRMADDYVALYRRLMATAASQPTFLRSGLKRP